MVAPRLIERGGQFPPGLLQRCAMCGSQSLNRLCMF